MKKQLEKVKQHLRENQRIYAVGTTCLVVGSAVTLVVTKGKGPKPTFALNHIRQLGFRNVATPTVITLIERSTPSKPVHLVGTNLYFNSLNEAARETGHHLSQLSKHVNGQLDNLNGDVFEVLQPAA